MSASKTNKERFSLGERERATEKEEGKIERRGRKKEGVIRENWRGREKERTWWTRGIHALSADQFTRKETGRAGERASASAMSHGVALDARHIESLRHAAKPLSRAPALMRVVSFSRFLIIPCGVP